MANITGGDLYSLWKIANVALPRVAAVYSSASSSMGGSEGSIQGAYVTGEGQYGQPTYGGSMEAFTNCYNEFHHILALTGSNIMDTSAALNKAIEEFRGQDGTASSDFDSIIAGEKVDGVQHHDPNDPNQNPPEEMPTEPDKPDNYDSPGDNSAENPDAERRDIEDAIDDLEEMEDK